MAVEPGSIAPGKSGEVISSSQKEISVLLNTRELRVGYNVILLFCASAICTVLAEDDPASLSEELNRQLLQQRLQEQRHEERMLDEVREWTQIFAEPPEASPQIEGGPCFTVEHVIVEGVTKLRDAALAQLSSAAEGQCLGLANINQLLRDITALYFDAGYVTTRAYLPQQSLASGTLRIQVIEGRIQSIQSDENAGVNITTAFPGRKDSLLNLRDIEQGVEQLNRLGSNNVWMELHPGTTPGDTIVAVYNNRTRPWQASIRLDNSGSQSTGEYLVRAQFSADHLLRSNDYLSLSYQTNPFNWTSDQQSHNAAMQFDVPFGYWLFGFNASYYHYESRVEGDSESFTTQGDSTSQALSASRVVYRGQRGKTEWINRLSRQRNTNYVEQVRLDTSSRTLAAGEVRLRHRHALPNQQMVQASIGLQQGLGLLGRRDTKPAQGGPNPYYILLSTDADYQRSWDMRGRPMHLSVSGAAQFSADRLYSSQQMGIGGQYSVRGFKGESLSGRNAAYTRTELSTTFRLGPNFAQVSNITPGVSWDFGGVFADRDSPYNNEWLHGVSASLRMGSRYVTSELTVSQALHRPEQFDNSKTVAYFSLTYQL